MTVVLVDVIGDSSALYMTDFTQSEAYRQLFSSRDYSKYSLVIQIL